MTFDVRFGVEAEDDLARLLDFVLDRAKTVGISGSLKQPSTPSDRRS